ncbi:MAG: SDR family NAD(P)-dependent oxidoreductase [Novosphingobium sp.]|nr:SDR family NAD(P)-dependent oxidoreductase [Novosphingobium sp.]
MDKPLAGKVAIVAGATRGAGNGIAVELGAAGAKTYCLGRTMHAGEGERSGSLEETIAEIEALGGQGVAIACDATDDAVLAEIFERVRRDEQRLDVLANSVFSAGRLAPFINMRFWETPANTWESVVDLGARSAWYASRHAAPLMIETAERHGCTPLIVNVTGRGSVRYRYNVIYGVGKSATERQTRDMALDLKDHGVAVVSVWPNGHTADRPHQETMRYSGRAVVALASDPAVMKRSGKYYWSAELGAEYGFTDEHGHTHVPGPLVDEFSLDEA